MRNFTQLSEQEQENAVLHCIRDILGCLVEEDMVPDCLDEYEEIIFAAMREAERLQTPWFFLDILQVEIDKNPEMKSVILTEAKSMAAISWYPGPDEMIVYLLPIVEEDDAKEDEKEESLEKVEDKKQFNIN
jgi:hypothetical protein